MLVAVVLVSVVAAVVVSPPPHAVKPSPVRAVATSIKRRTWPWLDEKFLNVFMIFKVLLVWLVLMEALATDAQRHRCMKVDLRDTLALLAFMPPLRLFRQAPALPCAHCEKTMWRKYGQILTIASQFPSPTASPANSTRANPTRAYPGIFATLLCIHDGAARERTHRPWMTDMSGL